MASPLPLNKLEEITLKSDETIHAHVEVVKNTRNVAGNKKSLPKREAGTVGAEGGTRTPTPVTGTRSLVLRVYQFHHFCTK